MKAAFKTEGNNDAICLVEQALRNVVGNVENLFQDVPQFLKRSSSLVWPMRPHFARSGRTTNRTLLKQGNNFRMLFSPWFYLPQTLDDALRLPQ